MKDYLVQVQATRMIPVQANSTEEAAEQAIMEALEVADFEAVVFEEGEPN